MSDIRLIVTVKNAVMLRAMEREGFDTATALAAASKTDKVMVGRYLNLKQAPMRPDGTWLPSILRIAETLRCLPEDLFPPRFLRVALQHNRAERDISADAAIALAGGTLSRSIAYEPDQALIQGEAKAALDSALASLRPRERAVLQMRFGMNGREPMTLDAVGRVINVQKERVRQIEMKALSRLRDGIRGKQMRAACSPLMGDE